jgi:predicted negative regulator of RcsB-dependent stress response
VRAVAEPKDADENLDRDQAGEGQEADAGESEGGERDASTAGVARALGVEDEGEGEVEEAAQAVPGEKAASNRAARRREEALKRRAKRASSSARSAGEGEEGDEPVEASKAAPLPKDRNARARELLKRRQEAAAQPPAGLSAGEMVQDSLARAGSATGKWFTDNFKGILGVLAVALVGTGAFLFYQEHQLRKAAEASDALARGLAADRARVLAEDKRSDEEKKLDPNLVFPSSEAKADAMLAAYQKVLTEHGGGGPGILAELGAAGAYLDKRAWDDALAAYSRVLASPLASADVDVRARALEGKGFALEGRGDLDGALTTFKELAAVDPSFADLGAYHEARLHALKGDLDKAKEQLKALEKKLELPLADGSQQLFLRTMVNETLRSVDPSSAKPRSPLAGPKGGQITPEELQRMQDDARKRLEELEKKKREKAEREGHEEHGDDSGLTPKPGNEP